MNELHLLPRLVTEALVTRLRVMPAVVVTGARQTGKSTLVKHLLAGERQYFSLDDLDTADQAARHPATLVSGAMPVTIDEVQRMPELLRSVKMAIDENRTPGRFLLTGSANLLLMKSVSESLAGRAAYLTLRPLSRGEQQGRASASLWASLIGSNASDWMEIINASPNEPQEWQDLARAGGFPTPATELNEWSSRDIWFDGYVRTYLERDLLELSSVASLPDFRRLMRVAANRVGQMLNQSELSRSVGIPQPTVHRYLNLMETSYMLTRLPAYSVNRNKRLIRTPKLYWGDTGLALHLAGRTDPDGSHLENLIFDDLMVSRDAGAAIDEIYYWRTVSGSEVDFVLESGDKLLPIEIKSSSSPRMRDCAGLESFLDEYPEASGHGLLLHTGDVVRWLTPRVLAVPWWRML